MRRPDLESIGKTHKAPWTITVSGDGWLFVRSRAGAILYRACIQNARNIGWGSAKLIAMAPDMKEYIHYLEAKILALGGKLND